MKLQGALSSKMDIDKPLDDIIKENKIGKRGNKGRGGKVASKRGGRGGKGAVSAPAAALRRNLAKRAATRTKPG